MCKVGAALAALAAPTDAPPTWPKDAAEVRAFMGVNFEVMKFGSEDQTPHDDDRYELTAHDFLSAVDWWADFPHAQPAADALAEPATVAWANIGTEEGEVYSVALARDEYHNDALVLRSESATQLQQAVARAREECAVICEAVAVRWGHHQVAPSAAHNCAQAIRAKGQPT